MVYVYLKRAATHRSGVNVVRFEAKVFGELGGPTGGEDTIDVRDGNASLIRHILDRLDMMLQRGDFSPHPSPIRFVE